MQVAAAGRRSAGGSRPWRRLGRLRIRARWRPCCGSSCGARWRWRSAGWRPRRRARLSAAPARRSGATPWSRSARRGSRSCAAGGSGRTPGARAPRSGRSAGTSSSPHCSPSSAATPRDRFSSISGHSPPEQRCFTAKRASAG